MRSLAVSGILCQRAARLAAIMVGLHDPEHHADDDMRMRALARLQLVAAGFPLP
jgi:hypothetical protein